MQKIATPNVVSQACAGLAAIDPSFAETIQLVGPVRFLPPRVDHFAYLVRSIVYQQLAGTAAKTIHGRLTRAANDDVTPQSLLALDREHFRTAGISHNKYLAIYDLADRSQRGELQLDSKTLQKLADDEIIGQLCEVRGIGPWTAQMFLMNQLRRVDVWPTGDLGVRRGFGIIHKTLTPVPKELEAAGEILRPYRSIAAVYCWRAIDLVRRYSPGLTSVTSQGPP